MVRRRAALSQVPPHCYPNDHTNAPAALHLVFIPAYSMPYELFPWKTDSSIAPFERLIKSITQLHPFDNSSF
ncbi:hypothetical protein Tcan_07628 [Toxocara canis]|uniref:Uncharacterized protein n=1 Tax=Toxocara canis TaxID=6265 RepID=A0A0B2V911_TOXCA|nr:hypothetical protein Tcan_07628 [Toxocara canis]